MLALILAGIGTFGIVGFIALAICAPPLAAAVAKGALKIVSKLWQTRLGMAAMVGTAAFLTGASLGDWKGAARVQARWDAAKIEYAAAMESLRQSAQAEAAEQARLAVEAERARTETAEQRISDYEHQLAAKPDTACGPISDDDLAAVDGRNVQPQRARRKWLRPFHRNPR